MIQLGAEKQQGSTNMEVRGQKCLELCHENRVTNIEKILSHASLKLRKAVLGVYELPSKTNVKKLIKDNISRSEKTKNLKHNVKCKEKKHRKQIVINVRRKPKKIIRYFTHSCSSKIKISLVIRRPGRLTYSKRSFRLYKMLQQRGKANMKVDLRKKAINELHKFVPVRKESLRGFPCIPPKFVFTVDATFKRNKRTSARKKSGQHGISKRRRKKQIRKNKSNKKEIKTQLPISDWKIVVKEKDLNMTTEFTELQKTDHFQPPSIDQKVSFSYEDIKTPTDRWRMIKAELPAVKTWTKKFSKSKIKTSNSPKFAVKNIGDETISKYINEQTETRLRKVVFSKWNMKSSADYLNASPHNKQTNNKKGLCSSVGKTFLSHISPPVSPDQSFQQISNRFSKKAKNKEFLNSDLLNEIIALQSSCIDLKFRPKKKRVTSLKLRKIRKRGHQKEMESFHSEDLLVNVNRSTSFWYELTTRSQTSSMTIEKQRLALNNDSDTSSDKSSKSCSRRSSTVTSRKPKQHLSVPVTSKSRYFSPNSQTNTSRVPSPNDSSVRRVVSLLDALFPTTCSAKISRPPATGWSLVADSVKHPVNVALR